MPAPGGILALDLSLSSTGYSYGAWGERPIFGHWKIGSLSHPGEAYAVLEDYCDDAIKVFRPRALVYEAPLPTHRQIDKSNPNATRSTNEIAITLIRLGGIVELIAVRHGLKYYHQSCTEARRHVLGKAPTGKSEQVKPIIMDWARRRNWAVTCDDEADALVLLAYAAVKLDSTNSAHFHRHGELL